MIRNKFSSGLIYEFDLNTTCNEEDFFQSCVNKVKNEVFPHANLDLEISYYDKLSVQNFLSKKVRFNLNSIISGICYISDNNNYYSMKFFQSDYFYSIQSEGYINFSDTFEIRNEEIYTEYNLQNQKVVLFPGGINFKVMPKKDISGQFLIFNSFFNTIPKVV